MSAPRTDSPIRDQYVVIIIALTFHARHGCIHNRARKTNNKDSDDSQTEVRIDTHCLALSSVVKNKRLLVPSINENQPSGGTLASNYFYFELGTSKLSTHRLEQQQSQQKTRL